MRSCHRGGKGRPFGVPLALCSFGMLFFYSSLVSAQSAPQPGLHQVAAKDPLARAPRLLSRDQAAQASEVEEEEAGQVGEQSRASRPKKK